MEIEFDPDKEATNLAKHGISLGKAELLNASTKIGWLHS